MNADAAIAVLREHRAAVGGRVRVPEIDEAAVRAFVGRVSEPDATGAVSPSTPIFDLRTIHRLKPLAAQCWYAESVAFRGCGCRGCAYHRGDVSLETCLRCAAELVRLD